MATVTYPLTNDLTPDQNEYFSNVRKDVPKAFDGNAQKINKWTYDKSRTEIPRDVNNWYNRAVRAEKKLAQTTLILEEEQKITTSLSKDLAQSQAELETTKAALVKKEADFNECKTQLAGYVEGYENWLTMTIKKLLLWIHRLPDK
jgi:chromosome segregation ATPase